MALCILQGPYSGKYESHRQQATTVSLAIGLMDQSVLLGFPWSCEYRRRRRMKKKMSKQAWRAAFSSMLLVKINTP
jgi:hypothetical protein